MDVSRELAQIFYLWYYQTTWVEMNRLMVDDTMGAGVVVHTYVMTREALGVAWMLMKSTLWIRLPGGTKQRICC